MTDLWHSLEDNNNHILWWESEKEKWNIRKQSRKKQNSVNPPRTAPVISHV